MQRGEIRVPDREQAAEAAPPRFGIEQPERGLRSVHRGDLLAAQAGRRVTAVDISEAALGLLGTEARRRGLGDLITVRHADLAALHLAPRHYALVLCTGFWDRAVFAEAAQSVAPGGLLGWEAFTLAALRARPKLCADWCLAPGEPASLLPADFEVIRIWDLPANEPGTKRRLLARRMTTPGPAGG